MKIDNLVMYQQVERLGAEFPWDEQVGLEIKREAGGKCQFWAYVPSNDTFGFDSVLTIEDSPEAAVDSAIKKAVNRNPETQREKKIAELKAKIDKLQAVVLGMPPFRPNRELAAGVVTVPETVEV